MEKLIVTLANLKKIKSKHIYTFDLSPISISFRDIDKYHNVEEIIDSIEAVGKINSLMKK